MYRPAVIAGDSKTGFTCSYHGLYLYLRLIATLVPQQPRDEHGILQTPITLPINGDEPRNIVTVDWVSQVICRIFDTPRAHGKTFHLSPDEFTTARNLIDHCYDYFNSAGVEYGGSHADLKSDQHGSFAEKFFANSRIYESYQTEDPLFDCSNLKQYAGDIPCPPVDREMIFKFLRFGESDRWGKKKSAIPNVGCWFNEKLIDVSQVNHELMADRLVFGVDIHGPGGGQWQVELDGRRRSIRPGLPVEPSVVITLNAEDLCASNADRESTHIPANSIQMTTAALLALSE